MIIFLDFGGLPRLFFGDCFSFSPISVNLCPVLFAAMYNGFNLSAVLFAFSIAAASICLRADLVLIASANVLIAFFSKSFLIAFFPPSIFLHIFRLLLFIFFFS
jgi:hypothetical protein